MRPRVVAAVLVAGAVAFAGPAWSHNTGGGHSGGGHSGGGGSHSTGGGHSGSGGHGGTVGGGHHGRGGHHWGGHFGWGPGFWWGGFPGWGWSFGWWGWWGPWWYDGLGYYDPGYWGPGVNGLTAVDTDVSPEAALVVLNGVVIGTADDFDGHPDYLYLKPGHYTIEFRLPGYVSQSRELDAGTEAQIPIDLELERDRSGNAVAPYQPPRGLPYGRVFGPDFGTASSQRQAAPDPTLRPELRWEHSHGSDVAGQPSATSGGATATLKLQVTPPNAAVYLDDVFLGSGEAVTRMLRGIAVTPGPHRIEVLSPGHAAKKVAVEAEADKELQVTIEVE